MALRTSRTQLLCHQLVDILAVFHLPIRDFGVCQTLDDRSGLRLPFRLDLDTFHVLADPACRRDCASTSPTCRARASAEMRSSACGRRTGCSSVRSRRTMSITIVGG